MRHERKSRTLWQKSVGNHWKSVGNQLEISWKSVERKSEITLRSELRTRSTLATPRETGPRNRRPRNPPRNRPRNRPAPKTGTQNQFKTRFKNLVVRIIILYSGPYILCDILCEGCDTSGNLVRSGRNQLEIIGNQLEITEIWLEIRNQDPVEIRKSARNHKKSSRNNEKHPLFCAVDLLRMRI